MNISLFLYILTLLIFENKALNKYKEDAQKDPFRMNKINQIWHKAQKRIKGPALADLYADLKIQDNLELKLKHLKSENKDKAGFMEADVRVKLRDIVNRHNLQDVIHLPTETNEVIDDGLPSELKDKKLQKLWKKAKMSGFSDEELEDLKKEFWHQQLKLDEFNLLKDEIKDIADLDNTLDGIDHEKNIKLKYMNRDIKDGYNKLETLGSKKDSGKSDLEFRDRRVYELYALARRSNMTEDELKSFMEELRHFEHRIDKHEYLKEELQMAEDLLEKEIKRGETPQKHVLLKQKANDYGQKVKKYHAELQKKVDQALEGHSEL